MRGRYLAFTWADVATERGKADALIADLTHRDHLIPVFACRSVVVLADASVARIELPSQRGVIFGEIFATGNNHVRRDSISNDEAERIVKTGGAELIAAYWGEYVAILHEPRTGDVTIVRDPSAGVPCFIGSFDGDRIFFSTADPLVERGILGSQVDWSVVAQHLIQGPFRTGQTAISDIHELIPGTAAQLRAGRWTETEIWTPWRFAASDQQIWSRADAVDLLRENVLGSTRAWVSRSPAALVELSGGLDSSIVAAALHRAGANIVCVTLVTPDVGGDERAYASAVAAHIGAPLHPIILAADRLDVTRLARSRRLRPSAHVLSHISDEIFEQVGREHGIDGFYGGNGGDYIFGYLGTSAPAADALLAYGPGRHFARSLNDLAVLYRSTIWKAGRLAVKKALSRRSMVSYRVTEFVSPSAAAEHFETHPWLVPPRGAWPGKFELIVSLAAGHESHDGKARGLFAPVREPLLAQPVVETSMRILSWMSIAGGRNRSVARDAFSDLLPDTIIKRRTKGDLTNFIGSIYQHNRVRLREFLLDGRLQQQGLLDRPAIEFHFHGTEPSSDTAASRIMHIACIEAWVRSWT